LIYFGLTTFAKIEVRISKPDLPETLNIDDNTWLSTSDIDKWQRFISLVMDDNKKFCILFKDSLHHNRGNIKDQFVRFTLDPQLKLVTYVFTNKLYQRCSDSTWTKWEKVFGSNITVKRAEYVRICDLHCDTDYHHFYLMPYYDDNLAISKTTEAFADTNLEAQIVNQKLKKAESESDKTGMFAYKEEFFEESTDWDENHWSKRLCGCLSEPFINANYYVKYTAHMGTDLFHDKEMVGFFKFHGSPDLIIKQKRDKQRIPVVSTQICDKPSLSSDEDDQDSQGTDTVAIENTITSDSTSRTKPRVLEKLGELLSNMHIILVKKALKQLKNPTGLELKGAVISRAIGTVHCKYLMPFVNIEVDTQMNSAQVIIETDRNPTTPSSVCVFLHHLINDVN